MYDKIRYCWNVFFYILWHFEIIFYKCMFWIVKHTFLKFLPTFLRNKAEENYHKGLLLYMGKKSGVGIIMANKEIEALALFHVLYLVAPITGVLFRYGYTNSLIPTGIFILLGIVMLHYSDKLIYEGKKRKSFFTRCESRGNQWYVKWYAITFTYYGFTILASTVGGFQMMDIIVHYKFK